LFLTPFIESQCADRITSLTWTVDNPQLASLLPEEPAYKGDCWVTGVRPGTTAVRARIVFSDGLVQEPKRAIQVVPLPAPSGNLVKKGTETSVIAGTFRFVPFNLPQDASLIDITIDWDSLFHTVDGELFEGTCSGVPCAGRIIGLSGGDTFNKPAQLHGVNLTAGSYTLRMNVSAGPETLRYEVRMTPK